MAWKETCALEEGGRFIVEYGLEDLTMAEIGRRCDISRKTGYKWLARPVLAILGSAAVFAVVHPPPSVAPVFVLGLAVAVAFRRTGLLLAPITANATHNAIALTAGCRLA